MGTNGFGSLLNSAMSTGRGILGKQLNKQSDEKAETAEASTDVKSPSKMFGGMTSWAKPNKRTSSV